MTAELAVAGAACFLLAAGHASIGARWVLPSLRQVRLPSTPFGPPSLTLSMLRFTWDVVTLFLAAFGVLLVTLAADRDVDLQTLLLRWFAALWVVATLRAWWDVRRRPSALLRLPVPVVFVLLAVLSWSASS